jgi:hypothetical protein
MIGRETTEMRDIRIEISQSVSEHVSRRRTTGDVSSSNQIPTSCLCSLTKQPFFQEEEEEDNNDNDDNVNIVIDLTAIMGR